MNKKSICLYFQVHQPTRLRLYRFFDIGKDSHYYDDFGNRTNIRRAIQECYLPMNAILLEQLKAKKGAYKVAFSIAGSTLEMFERYAPEVIDSFRALADTGQVEFLCETYYHSLASLASQAEFKHQVVKQRDKIEELFGVKPVTFRNTELIYSDSIGAAVYDMGFKTMLTEGAKHILGWKSPDYVYSCAAQPKLNVLMRNWSLSNDIAVRFSHTDWDVWPLTAEKYVEWLRGAEGDIVNLFLDYEAFGIFHPASSGIFDFMRALPDAVLADGTMQFVTPAEAVKNLKSVGPVEVEDAISWSNVESDMTVYLGNELQQDAFNKLYGLTEKLSILGDPVLWADFGHLQESANFYYMGTQFFSDGMPRKFANQYETPYEAFINYMNILSDFIIRVNDAMEVKK
jgi:alpha-amylase